MERSGSLRFLEWSLRGVSIQGVLMERKCGISIQGVLMEWKCGVSIQGVLMEWSSWIHIEGLTFGQTGHVD